MYRVLGTSQMHIFEVVKGGKGMVRLRCCAVVKR
jgi:hypothetical protein